MRTYAPADAPAVLDRLLEEPSLARGVVHHAVIPPRTAVHSPDAGLAGPAHRRRPRRSRHRAALQPPGRGDRGGPRRRGRRRRDPDRLGQDAVLRPPGPAGHRRRPGRPGPVPVPDQGPRPGPGRPSSASCRPRPGSSIITSTYDGDTPAPIRSAIRDGRPGRRDQPGHAPLGDPAPPHQVVPAVRAAQAHRHRRAAHVSRRVRRPRRQRPAPAAAASAPTTAATRSSSAARRRSGTPASSPRCSPGGRRGSSIATARRRASATSCSSTRR